MSPPRRRYDLLRKRLDRFAELLPGVESAEPEAVHRTRVASRRLRELLPVLELETGVAHKLGRRLRKVTRGLGGLREADVLLALTDELEQGGRQGRQALRRVSEQVRSEREHARVRLSGRAAFVELRRVGRKLERVADQLDQAADSRRSDRAWRWALDARVARRAQMLGAAIGKAGAVYLHERLHDVRIALKKLRYGVELSAEAAGTRQTADLRMLKRTQELLGRLHDLQVLIDRTREVQASLTPPDVASWRQFDALITTLEHECRRLHARFVRGRTDLLALTDRLAGRSSAAAGRRAG
jgi:CHAD domain-containing protein